MYEHQMTVLGTLWMGVNLFDQPGAEQGKQISVPVEQDEN